MLGIEVVLDLDAEVAGEALGAGADEQVVVGLVHDQLRDLGRGADALETGHASGAPLGAVHAAGVELHHAVGIGEPAVAHGILFRIELEDVDSGDQGVEHVAPLRHEPPGQLDAGLLAAVPVPVAVHRGDHHRLDRGAADRWAGQRERHRSGAEEPGGGALLEEATAGDRHEVHSLGRSRRGK